MIFKIEVDEDGYQLLVEDQESGVTDYGDKAEVEIDGVLYFATVLDEDAEKAVIYQMGDDGHPEPVTEAHEVEEVEFELEDDVDEDEDENEGVEVPA